MSIFSRKQTVDLNSFCRDYYEKNIINPVIQGIDVSEVYIDTVKKYLVEADKDFLNITSEMLASEIIPLRFELFALAWMHRFTGKFAIAQSIFTKNYLHEKGRDDIWDYMKYYNNAIDGATLNWLTNLGKMNLSFWYGMRKDLAAKNIDDAKKLGVEADESIDMVNNRLCSENAWKQKLILNTIVSVFCDRIAVDPNKLSDDAIFRLAATIFGLYEGAQQSLEKIKIED
jgi:hypothetical protein